MIWQNLRLAGKLGIAVGTATLGLVVFAFASLRTIERVKVNGPLYEEVVAMKDLIADVLPPPAYVVDANLLIHQLAVAGGGAAAEAGLQRLDALREEYRARQSYWREHLREDAIRIALLEESRGPGEEFFRLVREQFAPAIRARDIDRANELLRGPIAAAFEAHRTAIDRVVRLATEEAADVEAAAADVVGGSRLWILGFGASLVVAAASVGWLVSRALLRPITSLVHRARAIAAGDLTGAALAADGHDEAGELVEAVNRMQAAITGIVAEVKAGAQQID